ncbi:MAG: hypothetical protein V1922_02350 [bacterium]
MKKKKIYIFRFFTLIVYLFTTFSWYLLYLPQHVTPVVAASHTITSRIDFELGIQNGTDTASSEELLLKPDGVWGPRAFKTPNLTLSDQAAITSDGTYVYVMHNSDNHFVRYIPTENRWQTLSPSPRFSYPGAQLVVLGNYIYAEFGGYQKEFARYSIATNTWETLTDIPDLVYGGTSCATDGTNIFCLRGTGVTDFWKYTVATGVWTGITNPPLSMGTGTTFTYYAGDLYALRGQGTTTFYRYNITANTWYTTSTAGPALTLPPATINEDHTASIKGDEIFVTRDQATQTFYKYKISTNTWSTLTNTPQPTRYVGSVYNAADDYVYVFRGNGTYDFWKYNPTTNVFLGPTDLPNTPGSGADTIYYNGFIYYARGNNSALFYRYEIATGLWTTLNSAPGNFNDDTKGVLVGSTIYFFRGGTTNTFYKYDTSGGAWTTLTAVTPATAGYGATLAYPGTGDYMYATRGLVTRSFWRYQISTDTWSDPAVADLPDNAEAAYGARLTSDGTDIYYSAGYGMSSLLKYTIGTNTWTVINSLPFAPNWGTDMRYYGGKIFFQAGYYKTDFWEYTIASNTWRRLPNLQSTYYYNYGPYNGGSLTVDSSNGTVYSTSGQNISWIQQYTPSVYNFVASGVWTSNTIDTTYIQSFTSLTSSISTPGDSSVAFETRTSSDQITWEAWQTVTGGVIASTPARYVQIRATLTSSTGRTQTPTINSVQLNYVGDEVAPTNPATFTGISQAAGGVSITSGQSYKYTAPYFTWTAGTDTQTAVAGYYVYFGSDIFADPETAGVYKTDTNYLVTVPMTKGQTYYLRLQTKDVVGNISNATTEFVYTYIGVSPPQTITKTTTADFTDGTTTNTSTANDAIKLSSKAGFWQQERLSMPPSTIYYGSDLAYVSSTNKMYLNRGYGTNTFYEYDIPTDTWATKGTLPATAYYGDNVIEGPAGYLYGTRGQNTNSFWSYNISTNTWSDTAAADAPQPINYGGSLVYDGTKYIYALKGNSDDTFMRYDTSTDNWETLANTDFGAPEKQINNLTYDGADLAIDRANNTIYAIQGNTRSGFISYNPSNNSWTQLPNLPSLPAAGSKIEYDATTNAIYYLAGWSTTLFFKYDVESQTWSSLPDAPAAISAGSTLRNVNGTLYVLRGGGNQQFYKYNIAKQSWMIPNVGLFGGWFRGNDVRTYGYGADIIKGDGNNYYLVRGNFDNIFVRYNPTTGEITKLADAPAGFYLGGKLAYESTHNKIYATVNYYNRKLFVYDITADTWSEETSDPPPVDPGEGTTLVYDGSRYLYWTRGGATTSFYRFDTSASSGSKWSAALGAVPATLQYGSDLVVKDNYIYALRGQNTISFYRYGPLSGTPVWSDPAVADLPAGALVYNDGFLVDGGGDLLYACRGGNVAGCYSYSVSGNSWTAIANAPAQIYFGGSAAAIGTEKMLVIAGAGTNTYNNGLYSYIMQTSNTSFQESGSYTSGTIDLSAVYRFAGLNINYTTANNTTLTVSTRVSADNSTWDDWQAATDEKIVGANRTYKISSSTKRYMQVKFEMTSADGIYSPTINDYTISYYQDIDEPANPSAISGYTTSTKSATLTTGNWYNYSAPYFEWPAEDVTGGATDGSNGAGIAGYFVYFGASESANIVTEGTYQTTTNYTPSSLTAGQTYYLRMKTKDNAGNISSTEYSAFVYKFNDQKPDNPTTMTVDPPGSTNVNSYTFAWSGGTADVSYCYKTGAASSSPFYTPEICTNDTSVASISAYQEGNNTFYLRAKDIAGNYAAEYKTVTYQLLETAPSTVRNLTVTPEHSETGEFAFSWSPPEYFGGTQGGLKYYYSVNSLPTASNVTLAGSQSYLPSNFYASQVDKNTLYVVTKDEVGNISYNSYSSVDFYADTSAPGIPTNIDIADVSVKETSKWRLALSWDVPDASGSAGVSYYEIYRSTTADASCTTDSSLFTNVASTSQTSYVDVNLIQTKNYYCAKACNVTHQCSAASSTIGLLPDGKWRVAPELVASQSATVKTKSAIIEWSTNRKANSFVKYGKTSGTYANEAGSSTQVTLHSIPLNSLDPGTTYYYQSVWTDEDGNTGSSTELSFSTNTAPFVSSVKFTQVNINSARVAFMIKSAIKASVNYGKTLSYGSVESISTSKSETTYTMEIPSLTEGTIYHLRIAGEDDEANVYYSDDYTFETLPTPKILGLRLQQVVGMPTATLRLLWTTNTLASTIVTYYPTKLPQQATDSISLALKKSHEVILKNLLDDTDYTIEIKGKDSAGNAAKSETRALKTANDVRPPEIQNLNVESTIIGVGEDARAQIVVSWDTDEPGTTQVEYGQGTGTSYNQTTQEDSNKTLNHIVTITGLSPSKIYHLRALSKDKGNNVGQSLDTVIITPKSTKDALNLVIDNLSKTFGFIKGFTNK